MGFRTILQKLIPAAVRGAVRDFMWRLLNIRWTLRSGLAVEVRGLSDWVVYSDIFVDGEYDEAVEHALATLRPGERARILDIGANVGFFALRCLDIAQRRGVPWERLDLTLIEGAAAAHRDLTARVRSWGRAADVVSIRYGLAGLLDGFGTMAQRDLGCMSRVSTAAGGAPPSSRVPYIDLRPYLRATGSIQLLKCDIEGSELTFLETYGSELSAVRAIVIELHKDLCDTQRCIQILETAGFGGLRLLREMPTIAVAFLSR
jgi:FkbM family methyltransferase